MNCATTSQEDKDFNSKLVRLEGDVSGWYAVHLGGFNSKLVRLEGFRWAHLLPDGTPFQFQTGSIRRKRQHSASTIFCASFNSKLVRLEGKECSAWQASVCQFQFQTGSIRSTTSPVDMAE